MRKPQGLVYTRNGCHQVVPRTGLLEANTVTNAQTYKHNQKYPGGRVGKETIRFSIAAAAAGGVLRPKLNYL
jgi:hypothetical protein